MELPIDHFRLLGVSSSAGAEEILRIFQLRLDRAPDQGFTNEVLAQRAELLRLSADLLTEQSSRQEYENAISLGASGLELSSNREVAGLILLWEADFSYEAFKLARKSLQPPQTPALGSSREADLALIAALSCRDASLQQQDQRHYAFAAELLQEGIQLLQRMGKLSEHRQNLEQDLELLIPFRILDLLSRDLDDYNSHQEGLNLLDVFIAKRGGLEGRGKIKNYGGLTQSDFEVFFQQIRNFLTTQEQVDLFVNWYKQGSQDAGFLAAIALIASGFAFKKPQNLQLARKYLKNLNYQGLDPMPLIGCIDLLLGDLQQAEARFNSSNDLGLKDWLANYPGEELAAFCHYCRNWLKNDVLRGFRDIDIPSPELDSWFADQDVQDYLEQIENQGARALARAGRTFLSSLSTEKNDENISSKDIEVERSLPMPGGVRESIDNEDDFSEEESTAFIDGLIPANDLIKLVRSKVSSFNLSGVGNQFSKNPITSSIAVFLLLFFSGTAIGLLNLKIRNSNEVIKEQPISSNKINVKSNKASSLAIQNKAKVFRENNSKETSSTENKTGNITTNFDLISKTYTLSVDKPSEQQIQFLIEKWLLSKSNVLSGKEAIDFSSFVEEDLYKRVFDERSKDKSLKQNQIIEASISSLNVNSRTSKRISANVELNYKDQRIDASGKVISETIIPSLKVRYILGRTKDIWKLVDYVSGI